MKPTFKIINGQLCRMVEPTPLQLDSQMPCVVRYRKIFVELLEFWTCPKMPFAEHRMICNSIKNGVAYTSHTNMFAYDSHEIIGYPLVEGSKEWALWQMMQGANVIHRSSAKNEFVRLHGNLIFSDYLGSAFCKADDFLKTACADGWQIYTEPEHEYKVGDWVECVVKQGQRRLVDYLGGMGCYKTNYGEVISPCEILRKLSPYEVVIRIGCLSGTVRPVSTNGIHIWFHLIDVDDKTIAAICISYLDAPTRELVESLLKTQEEK